MALRQFHLMTKPTGPICNLDCEYCYYLEKESLYPGRHSWRMSPEVQEEYIKQYIEAQEVPVVQFAWQGGEPTLLGVEFFKRAVELQKKYANGKRIENAFQTNGTLLDDEWGEFLAKNKFLVGLSVDGPEHLHDAYRRDKRGRGTHAQVMRGLGFLKKHGAEFNTLTVVSRKNSQEPLEVYRYLKSIGSTFFQFIPLVERKAPPNGLLKLADPDQREVSEVTEWSVRAEDFGDFLIKIFDSWVRNDVAKVFVQQFDVALASWTGLEPPLCVFRKTCGEAMVMEHNGDVYSCDHYVYPQYKLGNVTRSSLREMAWSARQRAFGEDKRVTLTGHCRKCPSLFACNGDCPKHRFIKTPDGEPGLSYLCEGYKRFFAHIDRHMKRMAELLRQERAPAEIMAMLQEDDLTLAADVIGRNAPCPCGSGKKYKQCCMRSS
ncbi:MAG: anaerobic sulfatase maturase [Armatimonadetes bacterium]|nr:anaerobic sulfatase maturase [Armatimonadota bacterium]